MSECIVMHSWALLYQRARTTSMNMHRLPRKEDFFIMGNLLVQNHTTGSFQTPLHSYKDLKMVPINRNGYE